jgi:hypothetical protein
MALDARDDPGRVRWLRHPQPLGSKVCVYALYQRGALDPHVKKALIHLAACGYNIVAVNNGKLSPEAKDELMRFASAYAERPNYGRDFGAYKTGIMELGPARLAGLDGLLILNDSIYFPLFDNTTLLEEMEASPGTFVGVNENFEKDYHLGSYMILVKGEELKKPWFWRYWSDYLPYSSRHWAIHQGEIRFSRQAAKSGAKFDVIYDTPRLRPALRMLSNDELANAFALLGFLGPHALQDVAAKLGQRTAGLSPLDREVIVGLISQVIESRNQSHGAGLLFHLYCGAPFLKRDVVYRGTYSFATVVNHCRTDDPALAAFIEQDLRRKGLPVTLRGFKKWMYNRGTI